MASSGSPLADKACKRLSASKSQLTHRRLYELKSHASDSHRSREAAIFRGALMSLQERFASSFELPLIRLS